MKKSPVSAPKKRRKPHVRGNWKPRFLAELGKVGNVSAAAAVAGIDRGTATKARASDKAFAEKWGEVIDAVVDRMETEAFRRGVEGNSKPVFYQGVECGQVREHSDNLLMFMLKAKRPGEFRERLTVDDGVVISKESLKLLTRDEIRQAIAGDISRQQLHTIITIRQSMNAK